MNRRTRHHKQASTTRRKAARKRMIWRAAIAFAVVPAILIVYSTLSSGRLRLDSDRKTVVQQAAVTARIPYAIVGGRVPDCDPGHLRDYLETFTEGTADPSSIDTAALCLGHLQDSRAVAPLLTFLRGWDPEHMVPEDLPGFLEDFDFFPSATTDVLSILVAIGDNGCTELKEGLVDEAANVRIVAARALASMNSEPSVSALITSAEDREPVVRIAVSQTLEAIASSGVISPGKAFDLFQQMSSDPYPEVRANVATSLRIFRGSRPQELLQDMAQDLDEDVRKAAERTLLHF